MVRIRSMRMQMSQRTEGPRRTVRSRRSYEAMSAPVSRPGFQEERCAGGGHCAQAEHQQDRPDDAAAPIARRGIAFPCAKPHRPHTAQRAIQRKAEPGAQVEQAREQPRIHRSEQDLRERVRAPNRKAAPKAANTPGCLMRVAKPDLLPTLPMRQPIQHRQAPAASAPSRRGSRRSPPWQAGAAPPPRCRC